MAAWTPRFSYWRKGILAAGWFVLAGATTASNSVCTAACGVISGRSLALAGADKPICIEACVTTDILRFPFTRSL